MARVFITGSADGLGQLAADALISQGHKIVLHARNEKRGLEARDKVPGAENVVTADLSRITYSDSKLHVLMLCLAVARKWPQVYANAVDPGWVPTKMGGKAATDDLQKG